MSSLGMSSLGTVVVWFCPGICKCLFCIQSRYTLRMNFHKSWAKHQSWGVMGISSLDTLHVESQNWEIFCKTNTGAYHVRLHVWGPIMGRLLLKEMTKVGQSRAGQGLSAPDTIFRWGISAGETAAGASDHWILYEALHLLADLQVPLAASPRNIPKPGGK